MTFGNLANAMDIVIRLLPASVTTEFGFRRRGDSDAPFISYNQGSNTLFEKDTVFDLGMCFALVIGLQI